MTATISEKDNWLGCVEELIRRVMLEAVAPREQATELAQKILEIHESLRPAFREWFTTASLQGTPEISGYSVERILAEGITGGGVPCAFLWLDALVKRPEQALQSIRDIKAGFGRLALPNQWKANHH